MYQTELLLVTASTHPAEGKFGPVQLGTLACGNTRVPQTAMLASAVLPGPPHGWAKDEKEISNKKANVKRRIGSLLCTKNKQNIALFPGFTGGWLITCYQFKLFRPTTVGGDKEEVKRKNQKESPIASLNEFSREGFTTLGISCFLWAGGDKEQVKSKNQKGASKNRLTDFSRTGFKHFQVFHAFSVPLCLRVFVFQKKSLQTSFINKCKE